MAIQQTVAGVGNWLSTHPMKATGLGFLAGIGSKFIPEGLFPPTGDGDLSSFVGQFPGAEGFALSMDLADKGLQIAGQLNFNLGSNRPLMLDMVGIESSFMPDRTGVSIPALQDNKTYISER